MSRLALNVRAGLLVALALVALLGVEAVRPPVSRAASAARPQAGSQPIRVGDMVLYRGDGFDLTWEVMGVCEGTVLVRRGEQEAYVDLIELVRKS